MSRSQYVLTRSITDPNDFPALGSHPVLSNSSYAAQAQPSQNSPALNPQHPQLAQQMFMQQQQMGGLVPPPPPGIGGPADSSSAHTNGMIGDNLRREDFPALGAGPDGKDRVGGRSTEGRSFLTKSAVADGKLPEICKSQSTPSISSFYTSQRC